MRSSSIFLRVAAVVVGPAIIASVLLTPFAGWKLGSAMGLTVLIVGLIIAVPISRSIAANITRLGNEVHRIADGGLQFRCQPQGPPELRQLADHINRIVKHLEDAQAERRNHVREQKLYLEQSNRALLDLANRDALTGLPNRRRLEKELERQIAMSRESQRPLAVIMMDLDKFKVFNDTAGHLAGDQLLKKVADTLRARTRVTDLVVRWGGDEFCVLIACSNSDGAVAAAQGLVDAIQGAIRDLPQSEQIAGLGASAGVACFPDDAEDAEELIARADDALYRVKEGGRGHAVRYSGLSEDERQRQHE